MQIDFNCDMGESFGPYSFGADEELMRYISSANVAGGFHAGDPHVMRRTVELARENGVAVGVHNGYRDLVGFGRREIGVSPDEIHDELIYQLGALREFARLYGADGQIVFTRKVTEESDPDEVADRVVRGVTEGKVTTVDGTDIDIPSDSVCVHSDTPGAARLAEAIVRKLKENDIEVRPLGRAKQKIS